VGLDFVAPHRPRDADSPGQTEARTRDCLVQFQESCCVSRSSCSQP
jgi:hypothetical protein